MELSRVLHLVGVSLEEVEEVVHDGGPEVAHAVSSPHHSRAVLVAIGVTVVVHQQEERQDLLVEVDAEGELGDGEGEEHVRKEVGLVVALDVLDALGKPHGDAAVLLSRDTNTREGVLHVCAEHEVCESIVGLAGCAVDGVTRQRAALDVGESHVGRVVHDV